MCIHYELGGAELLDSVKDLWGQLSELHREKSLYFKQFYADFTFEERKKPLLDAAQSGGLLVALAFIGGELAGYCLASAARGAGEIESIYVVPERRKMGIGGGLMDRALAWLKQNGAERISIGVAYGNEQAFGFYAKHGFFPRVTVLRQTRSEGNK